LPALEVKCRDLAAECPCELERQVTEAADSDHADAVGRPHVELVHRREHRDAAAKQWSGRGGVQALGQWKGAAPVATNALGVAAVPADDGLLGVQTMVLPSDQALAAVATSLRVPAEADPVAEAVALGGGSHGGDSPDRFVAGNERVARVAPLVVELGQIGMAHAAVFDRDLELLVAERARVELERAQCATGGLRRVRPDRLAHGQLRFVPRNAG
jgi:hypothetical protein